ncbi:hypothetical protein [Archangium lansingense]|uniref:Uncharacterized protein n=1 Tax=Archangium lansingense TaxID=2995310 RepID=A0ABT4AN79_9BACT|nr:hypothetical protein [Archangium lansinium]MCY1083135.1 hypothetical protein [Archangium lansinium]
MHASRILTALLAGLVSFSALAAEQYDYSRIIQGSNMVFVPFVGSNYGPVYYTQYAQQTTPMGISGDLRRMTVNLRPTAHLPTSAVYNSFISANSISDTRVVPVPANGSCQPTQELKDLVSSMPAQFKPTILTGGYPNICAVNIYFWPHQEQAVRDLIAARPVIIMQASIPMCDPNGPALNVSAINQELIAQGVLQTNGAGDVYGNYWNLVFEATRLALLNPSLFVSADPKVGWEVYMKLFQVDSSTGIATMPAASQGPAYMCTPAPLNISYGVPVVP